MRTQLYAYPPSHPLWWAAATATAISIVLAFGGVFGLDVGSVHRGLRRVAVRGSWPSVARSAGLAITRDKRTVHTGHGPGLLTVLAGPVDARRGSTSAPTTTTIERLPTLKHGRATSSRAAVVYTVRPPRGGSLDQIAAVSDELAAAMGVHAVHLERVRPDMGRLTVVIEDSLAKSRPWPGPGCGVGVTVTGEPLRFPLIGGHWLIAGVTRSGKSVWLQAVIADVLTSGVPHHIVAIDPKVVELSLVAAAVDRLIIDPAEIGEALAAEHYEVRSRYQRLSAQGLRKLEAPTSEMPLRLLIVDELGEVARQGPGESREAPKERMRLLSSLAAIGAGAGLVLVCCTQRPSAQLIGGDLRANLTRRVACRMSDEFGGEATLGDIAAQLRPQDIPHASKGVAWVVSEEHPHPQMARSYWLTDDQVAAIARAHPAPRPAELPAVTS